MTPKQVDPKKLFLRGIMQSTLRAVERGSFDLGDDTVYIGDAAKKTAHSSQFAADDCALSAWPTYIPKHVLSSTRPCRTTIQQMTTLAAVQSLASSNQNGGRIGVLNFASPKAPGGMVHDGVQGQEASLFRSSSLYYSLANEDMSIYYNQNRLDPYGGYYSHAIIFSPDVVIFRDDDGNWHNPVAVDVISSSPVDLTVVRKTFMGTFASKREEAKTVKVMTERMARILHSFERNETRHVVLGAFGTGSYGNNVASMARAWADLVGCEGSRFSMSFDRVVFAVPDKDTYVDFLEAFERRVNGKD